MSNVDISYVWGHWWSRPDQKEFDSVPVVPGARLGMPGYHIMCPEGAALHGLVPGVPGTLRVSDTEFPGSLRVEFPTQKQEHVLVGTRMFHEGVCDTLAGIMRGLYRDPCYARHVFHIGPLPADQEGKEKP